MEEQSVLNVEGSGLTKDEEANVRTVAQLVREQGPAVDMFIKSYGIKPNPDETEKALQLILISSQVPTQSFDDRLAKAVGTRELLGLGAVIAGIGSVFKKKEGGTKVGNFFRKLFGKKTPGAPGAPTADQAALYAQMQEQQRLEEEKEKEEEEAKKKMNRIIGFSIAGGIIVIVIVIVLIQGQRKKKKG